jgi:tetratricopeptide (TPR) repeat protein
MNKKIAAAMACILIIFTVHAMSLNFIQDDAFISYRYVQNFVGGRGLVFNAGERVEGYTNFLWIILLALFTVLGINTVMASKILGLAGGWLSLVLLYRIARFLLQEEGIRGIQPTGQEGRQGHEDRLEHIGLKVRPEPAKGTIPADRMRRADWIALAPPLLLAANGAFAYWCISGLESGLFVPLILAAIYFSLTRERLMVVCAVLATLVRPEGALVFAVIMLHRLLFGRGGLRDLLRFTAAYIALLLPYLLFKIAYYGDLLPNPFYAKTGLSWEYLRSGLDYFWLFLRHYGLWGGLYLLTPIGWKRSPDGGKDSSRPRRLIILMIWIYSLAVILIGGDVLQGHRFFLPVLPFLYLLVGWGLFRFGGSIASGPLRRILPATALAILLAITFFLPRPWLLTVRRAEFGLGRKMALMAAELDDRFDGPYTVAASTIGALSYYSRATVIDMLGLTDPVIARHPEPIPGIVSSWKERDYNGRYVLSRDPDVILFSTGMKPSAPAERALLLYSKFRDHYYPYYLPQGDLLQVIFRRKPGPAAENRLFPEARPANLFNEIMSLESRNLLSMAVEKTEELIAVGPPDFSWAEDKMASLYFLMGNRAEALRYARRAIRMDDYCMLSHYILQEISLAEGDTAAARRERDKILRYNPELLRLNAGKERRL